ncbi:hypothetical protein BDV96DRAFT_604334 [Lophiotrema nucula]|uniref:Uncharacterized protein n=1 Tax=Lophiotrema nucula TaxID=690887 RepID=A0A6A5YS68_9PLEO|nr:hypothetical protein BDV96DRAFT_604334 [Lophiotrema nucula]
MSSRHHIPFPKAFLSLNTPPSKLTAEGVAALELEAAGHNFLSNRPDVARHSSISSVSSSSSTGSVPESPSSIAVDASPVAKQAVATFLALNTKYAAAPIVASPIGVEKSAFLSNKH